MEPDESVAGLLVRGALPAPIAKVRPPEENAMDQYLLWALLLLVLTAVLTAAVFWRKRGIEYGPVKGRATNPARVRRPNPPD